jgi:hypothetical protein
MKSARVRNWVGNGLYKRCFLLLASAVARVLFSRDGNDSGPAYARCFSIEGIICIASLPFGRLWYDERNAVSNAIGYAEFYSRSYNAVIRVYD